MTALCVTFISEPRDDTEQLSLNNSGKKSMKLSVTHAWSMTFTAHAFFTTLSHSRQKFCISISIHGYRKKIHTIARFNSIQFTNYTTLFKKTTKTQRPTWKKTTNKKNFRTKLFFSVNIYVNTNTSISFKFQSSTTFFIFSTRWKNFYNLIIPCFSHILTYMFWTNINILFYTK